MNTVSSSIRFVGSLFKPRVFFFYIYIEGFSILFSIEPSAQRYIILNHKKIEIKKKMKSVVIFLIILSILGAESTSTFKDSPTDTNHAVDLHKFCKLGCVFSLCSNVSTPENLSELISSTLVLPILFLYIFG